MPKLATDHQKRQNDALDEARSLVTEVWPPGSLVMIRNPRDSKHAPRWVGPFLVERRTRGLAYVLRDLDNKVLQRHFPVSQLKHVSDTNIPLTTADGGAMLSGEARGVVVAITTHRPSPKGMRGDEYLVRWKGYPEVADSWIGEGDFDDASTITAYWSRVRPATKRKIPQKQQLQSEGAQLVTSRGTSLHTSLR